jgi:hypothetical protein
MDFYLAPSAQSVSNAVPAMPYGVEGPLLYISATADATLAANPDVYACPALTYIMQDADVTALGSFCTTNNIPSSWITSGMTMLAVLQGLARIFALAIALSAAAGGASIFSGGATLSSAVETVNVSKGLGHNNSVGTPSALTSAVGSVVGPFDLTGVATSDTIDDVLTEVAQQLTLYVASGSGQ